MMDTQFIPLAGAKNPHLQTILPRWFRKKVQFNPFWQRLELPDGDFVDLAWNAPPQKTTNQPRVVLFHGLEGSFYSPYVHGLLNACKEKNWQAVVMHFRGCSGEPNRNQRIYHSGETSDARYVLNWLRNNYGATPTATVGFSLGGNMLGCYLGQDKSEACTDAAVIVSAPLMLGPCSLKLEQGFSRVYNHYLLAELKKNARRKLELYPGSLPVTVEELNKCKLIRDFDNLITAPIHGYKNADDYYQQCSAMQFLDKIEKPLLIIHAKDDPFMSPDVILDQTKLPPNIEYQLTEYGGHVGFVSGSWQNPQMWLETRITQWLSTQLRQL